MTLKMLANETRTPVISFGATKEAALYFDTVVPLFVSYEAVDEGLKRAPEGLDAKNAVFAQLDRTTGELVDAILPRHLKESDEFIAGWRRLELLGSILRFKPGIDEHPLGSDPKFLDTFLNGLGVSLEVYRDALGEFSRQLNELAERFGFRGSPIVAPELSGVYDIGETDIMISIRGLELIDLSVASWEQVVEFRKDKESCARLRQLRVFAVQNYSGRPISFVEDDLLRRIDQYQETIRRWGFATIYATMGTVLSSKTLGTALGATFVSVLAGTPTLAAVVAGGGVALELGRVVVDVSRRRFELRSMLSDDPVAYLVDAKKRLEG